MVQRNIASSSLEKDFHFEIPFTPSSSGDFETAAAGFCIGFCDESLLSLSEQQSCVGEVAQNLQANVNS